MRHRRIVIALLYYVSLILVADQFNFQYLKANLGCLKNFLLCGSAICGTCISFREFESLLMKRSMFLIHFKAAVDVWILILNLHDQVNQVYQTS